MYYKDAQEFKQLNGYMIDGLWYPRVTKILDIKSKPALDIFFKEMGTYESAEEVKNRSAVEGSLVHETVQKLLTGERVEIPKEIEPAVTAFQRFNEKKNIIFHKEYVERRIKSLRHRYAGTVDALATVDGKFGVLDIKTSTGFYPEYNLQTAAYMLALQEFPLRRELALSRDIETRWILRINQQSVCNVCEATLREKGGRKKIRQKKKNVFSCPDNAHEWGEREGDIEIKEFPYVYDDIKGFVAAKILWEWEHSFWLKRIGYIK